MNGLLESIWHQFTDLPKTGTPVANLTDRDKLAIAYAAGVPCEIVMEGNFMRFESKVPFGIADRGDGGYIVACLQEDTP